MTSGRFIGPLIMKARLIYSRVVKLKLGWDTNISLHTYRDHKGSASVTYRDLGAQTYLAATKKSMGT